MTERIHSAIVAVARGIGAIEKSRENTQQHYKFRGIEDVYNRLQPLMSRHGIFSVPQVMESKQEIGKSKQGGTLIHVMLTVKYQFFADDGSHVDVIVSGQGMDSGDKATAKAMTSCHKTALCQLFSIAYKVIDPDQFTPEWAVAYTERVSMKALGDLKRNWHKSIDANCKSKDELGKMFALWVGEKTSHEFDVSDPRHWTRDDWLTCTEALVSSTEEKVETSNAD